MPCSLIYRRMTRCRRWARIPNETTSFVLQISPSFHTTTMRRQSTVQQHPQQQIAPEVPRNRPPDPARQIQIFHEVASLKRQYRESMRQVRKEFASEVAEQRASDEALRKARREEVAIATARRKHAKLLRSIENERRVRQDREIRRKEWEEELRQTQIRRDARKERFRKARQLVIDELEEECHLWMVTHEEVEAALHGDDNMQRLWARPHSIIGAMPEDATFWRYTADTWHMNKTYKTPAEHFYEEMQENAYDMVNTNANYWDTVVDETTGITREDMAIVMEERARLRAIVRNGATRHMVQRSVEEERRDMPSNPTLAHLMPRNKGAIVPPNHPLREHVAKMDEQALEEVESAVALNRSNLTKIFLIDEDTGEGTVRPHEPWPETYARHPPPDTRTEKEKARQKKLFEAEWAAGDKGGADDDAFSFLDNSEENSDEASENEIDSTTDEEGRVNNDGEHLVDLSSVDDPLWRKILTGKVDEMVNEKEFDGIIEKWEKRVSFLKKLVETDTRSRPSGDSTHFMSGVSSTSQDMKAKSEAKAREIVDGLTVEQKRAIEEIDIDEFCGEDDVPHLLSALRKIEGLTEDQIQAIVDVEIAYAKADAAPKETSPH